MYYYQARISVVEGKKIYGDLPENYTVGYEKVDTQTAYFPLLQKLNEHYVEVTEISKEVFEQELEEINRLANEKRQAEFEEARNVIAERQQEFEQLKNEKESLKQQLAQTNSDLAGFMEFIMNGGM